MRRYRAPGADRRNVARPGAAAIRAAGVATAFAMWKLAEAASIGWDTSHGTGVLLSLPFVAVVAFVGMAAWSVADAMLRPHR